MPRQKKRHVPLARSTGSQELDDLLRAVDKLRKKRRESWKTFKAKVAQAGRSQAVIEAVEAAEQICSVDRGRSSRRARVRPRRK